MEDTKEEKQEETIEELLTEDYGDKKYQKKKKKEAKKKQKLEKKKQNSEKKKERKKLKATELEDPLIVEKKKKKRKKILIISIIMIGIIFLGIAAILIIMPKIKLIGDKYVKVEFGEHYEEKGCTATYLGKDISDKIWYKGEVNEEKLGTYTIKCSVRKNRLTASKERIVEIVDTKEPVIELIGDKDKIICPNKEYNEEGFKAIDNYDGDLTEKVLIEKKDDKIIYKVLDSSKNEATMTRTIIKEDKTAPELSLKGNETVYVTLSNSYSEPGYTAIDNCEDDLSSKVKVDGSVDTNIVGTYTLKYTVSDSYGNESSKERKVVVQKTYAKVGGNSKCGNAGVIYLTFDDGPHGTYTPAILDTLKKYNVKATFFVLGSLVNSYPNIVKREVNEGHAVGIHTWSHDYATIYRSSDAFWNEVNRTHDAIKNATGYDSKLIRFPGGASNTVSRKYSTGIMSRLANEVVAKGYNYYDWNISSGDAGGTTDPNQEYRNVIGSLSKSRGNVILMHDIKKHTMNAIENIIKYGLDNGYTFEVLNLNINCKQSTNN